MFKITLKPKYKIKLAELEIKQTELAEKIGVTKQTINNIVKGRTNPTLEMCFIISYILKCKIDDLYTYEITEITD